MRVRQQKMEGEEGKWEDEKVESDLWVGDLCGMTEVF